MSLLKSIASLLIQDKQEVIAQDPTVYQIDTLIGTYEGKIVYQDDVVIRLRINEEKMVKILKVNINRIRIVNAG